MPRVEVPSAHLYLPLLVSHSQQGIGGHLEDLSFLLFVATIYDKNYPKPLVVTGALHAIH